MKVYVIVEGGGHLELRDNFAAKLVKRIESDFGLDLTDRTSRGVATINASSLSQAELFKRITPTAGKAPAKGQPGRASTTS